MMPYIQVYWANTKGKDAHGSTPPRDRLYRPLHGWPLQCFIPQSGHPADAFLFVLYWINMQPGTLLFARKSFGAASLSATSRSRADEPCQRLVPEERPCALSWSGSYVGCGKLSDASTLGPLP
jgi:hypothetical protein